MTVEKVERAEYINAGDSEGFIRVHLRDLFKPYLLGSHYCDYITIWWDSEAHEYDASVKVYAVTEIDGGDDIIGRAEEWYDFELIEAINYTMEELV